VDVFTKNVVGDLYDKHTNDMVGKAEEMIDNRNSVGRYCQHFKQSWRNKGQTKIIFSLRMTEWLGFTYLGSK